MWYDVASPTLWDRQSEPLGTRNTIMRHALAWHTTACAKSEWLSWSLISDTCFRWFTYAKLTGVNCPDHASPVIFDHESGETMYRQFRLPKAGAAADPLAVGQTVITQSPHATPVLLCESAIAWQWVDLPSAFPISHSCRKQEGRVLIRKSMAKPCQSIGLMSDATSQPE